jgi:hypothetical protein
MQRISVNSHAQPFGELVARLLWLMDSPYRELGMVTHTTPQCEDLQTVLASSAEEFIRLFDDSSRYDEMLDGF